MRKSLVWIGGPACLVLVSLAGMWLAPRAASGQRDSQPGAAPAGDASAFQSLLGQRRPVTLSEVLPGIHVATGNGSSFRIDTPDGAVIIDTGLVTHAARMRELLLGVSDQPVKYLILTHAHADHVGGAPLWIADGVPVIAGRHFRLRHLEHNRLGRYRGRRAAALWSNVMAGWGSRGTPAGQPRRLRDLPVIEPYVIEPDIVVDDSYTFTLGGVRFEVIWLNGAEGPDAIGVWLPERRIIFIGDAFGPNSFPNLFTLRGENLRDAFATAEAIDRVLALEPEVLLTGHHGQFRSPQAGPNEALAGGEAIRDTLTRTRDAIRYVHDATVAGMNEGQGRVDADARDRAAARACDLPGVRPRAVGCFARFTSTTPAGSATSRRRSSSRCRRATCTPTSPPWPAGMRSRRARRSTCRPTARWRRST